MFSFPQRRDHLYGSFNATLCPTLPPGSTLAGSTEQVFIEMLVFTSLDSLDPQEDPLHRWALWSQVLFLIVPPPISQIQDGLCSFTPFQGQCGHVTCFGQWRVSRSVRQPVQVHALRASAQFTTSHFCPGTSSQQFSTMPILHQIDYDQ